MPDITIYCEAGEWKFRCVVCAKDIVSAGAAHNPGMKSTIKYRIATSDLLKSYLRLHGGKSCHCHILIQPPCNAKIL